MFLIDYKTALPEENIALDEFLLEQAEKGRIGRSLRFWSSESVFIVLGRAKKTEDDCRLDNCQRDGIRVIRRISGGGTVLQGPGCLNYSLVLPYSDDSEYKKISSSYLNIMGSLIRGLKQEGYNVEFFPVSDLAMDGRKFSGNAQSRRKKYFLHHGTFLHGFDIGIIGDYLKYPGEEPAYRRGRSHEEFLANIPFTERRIKNTIKECFLGDNVIRWAPGKEDLVAIRALASGKYSSDEWNYAL